MLIIFFQGFIMITIRLFLVYTITLFCISSMSCLVTSSQGDIVADIINLIDIYYSSPKSIFDEYEDRNYLIITDYGNVLNSELLLETLYNYKMYYPSDLIYIYISDKNISSKPSDFIFIKDSYTTRKVKTLCNGKDVVLIKAGSLVFSGFFNESKPNRVIIEAHLQYSDIRDYRIIKEGNRHEEVIDTISLIDSYGNSENAIFAIFIAANPTYNCEVNNLLTAFDNAVYNSGISGVVIFTHPLSEKDIPHLSYNFSVKCPVEYAPFNCRNR